MRQISSADAFRELNIWRDSRVGCVFSVRSAAAVFSVRRAKLGVRESIVYIEAETGAGMLDLLDCKFSLTEPGDLPLELKEGFPPLTVVTLRIDFKNEDVCFFFPD